MPPPEPKAPPLSAADRLGMDTALDEAQYAVHVGEVPVGAAIVFEGKVLASAHNETVAQQDLTRHAEVIAIQQALDALTVDRLEGATMCVTLEPCAQCAGAIILARISSVLFGAYDPKAGMAGSVEDLLRHPKLNHNPEVRGGVMEKECGELLSEFFEGKR